MILSPLLLAALACGSLLLLGGVLAGIWLGFRVVTRDASILAGVKRDAESARDEARAAQRGVRELGDRLDDEFERVERKRASASGALAKLEAARAAKAEPEATEIPASALVGPLLPEHLTGRERRLALGRMIR